LNMCCVFIETKLNEGDPTVVIKVVEFSLDQFWLSRFDLNFKFL